MPVDLHALGGGKGPEEAINRGAEGRGSDLLGQDRGFGGRDP